MQAFGQFLNNNKGIFITALSVFAAGIVAGTAVACRMGAAQSAQLTEQLSGYISGGGADALGFSALFAARCAQNLQYMLTVLLCSRSVYLLPVAAVVLGVKGYQLGLAVCFVCGNFGARGVAVALASTLFSYILIIPLYILAFVLAVVYSPRVRANGTYRKGETAALCAAMAVLYGILCIAAVAEGFVIPLFNSVAAFY